MERRVVVPSVAATTAILLLFLQACTAFPISHCPASSCGNILNISYPFRLRGDPPNCGDKRYELECKNNATVLTLFSGKYHVHHIDYKSYKIRVSDVGVVEDTTCSFIPRYFLSSHSFSQMYAVPAALTDPLYLDRFDSPRIAYIKCASPITDDPRYVGVDTTRCGSGGYEYAVLKDSSNDFSMIDIKVGCQLKVATFVNWETVQQYRNKKNLSYADIHNMLAYGFRLSWLYVICEDLCGNGVNCRVTNGSTGEVQCDQEQISQSCSYVLENNAVTYKCSGGGGLFNLIIIIGFFGIGVAKGLLQIFGVNIAREYNETEVNIAQGMGRYVLPYFAVRYLLGVIAFIALLIYKWGRRHTSKYDSIEYFLRGNTLVPIRYSYKEIKQMTKGFKEKLGQGGFGSVYKGKLRSGPFVAIKMLSKSKTSGQDFINEVATIGRIHHANVVRLIGFCVEGSKRALVYEFMSNGSLDKYIFSKEDSISLTFEQIYEISLGVACGIAYLHQGCDMQILHFDIKPHNILLDENLMPKVSDFGLAKLYPIDKSIVTLTAARGTIGYMAPELFYHNIGGVSYKADIYSFGMLLMEMTNKRKNLNKQAQHSSELFFPLWIYDHLSEENNRGMEDITIEEKNNDAKKMFLVALWCIQLKPSDRPSMNKVVEMLEGELENIEMPPKPSLYPHEIIQEDLKSNFDQTQSDDSVSSTSYIEESIVHNS